MPTKKSIILIPLILGEADVCLRPKEIIFAFPD